MSFIKQIALVFTFPSVGFYTEIRLSQKPTSVRSQRATWWLVYFICNKFCTQPLFCLASLFIRLCICLFVTSLCVFVCICLFITTLISSYFSAWPIQPLSAISFCYFWVAVLSFFHNYFLLMSLHFCINSTIKDKDTFSWRYLSFVLLYFGFWTILVHGSYDDDSSH